MTKRFGETVAVDGISLDIAQGGFFAMLGPSGCGKTTTLRMIGGFEDPTEGRIELAGRDVTHAPPYKRDVNTVFQSYALFPHLTIERNVGFGLEQKRVPKDERRRPRTQLGAGIVVGPGADLPVRADLRDRPVLVQRQQGSLQLHVLRTC